MSANSKRPEPYLAEVQAHDGTGVVTLRVSTHSLVTPPTDTPPNTFYEGRITDIGGIQREIWEDGGTSGKASVDVGFIQLANADGGVDAWIDYGWGREVVIKSLRSSQIASAGMIVLRAIVEGIDTPDALRSLTLRMRSRMTELDQPVLVDRYLGTTTSVDSTDIAEGDVDLKDTLKPMVFGKALNVPGILVNKVYLIYQFASNPVSSITPYDGGINTGFTFAGDFGDVNSLRAVTVAPGAYATCLHEGMVKFGSVPAFEVTADVLEGDFLSDRSASRVARRILALSADIDDADVDDASFDRLHAAAPAQVGIYISADTAFIDLISQVLDSCAGALVVDALGVFSVFRNSGPSATTDGLFTLHDLISGGGSQMTLFAGPPTGIQGVPAYQVTVNWGKIWRTQSAGQLAPVIAEATTGNDLARKQLVGIETRQATATDASVLLKHPLANQIVIDTLLTEQADALAFAADRLAIYKARRDHIDFPVTMDQDDRGKIELGRSVRIQLQNRGRYNGGVNMMVLGRRDDFARRLRTLHLWG